MESPKSIKTVTSHSIKLIQHLDLLSLHLSLNSIVMNHSVVMLFLEISRWQKRTKLFLKVKEFDLIVAPSTTSSSHFLQSPSSMHLNTTRSSHNKKTSIQQQKRQQIEQKTFETQTILIENNVSKITLQQAVMIHRFLFTKNSKMSSLENFKSFLFRDPGSVVLNMMT